MQFRSGDHTATVKVISFTEEELKGEVKVTEFVGGTERSHL